jgi:hypothetical protein
LLPLVGEAESHDVALLCTVTVQEVLEVTVIVGDVPPLATGFHVRGETSRITSASACVTLIVRVIPPSLTITVALREDVVVFAVAVIVNVLSLLPLVREVESHDVALLCTVTVQD